MKDFLWAIIIHKSWTSFLGEVFFLKLKNLDYPCKKEKQRTNEIWVERLGILIHPEIGNSLILVKNLPQEFASNSPLVLFLIYPLVLAISCNRSFKTEWTDTAPVPSTQVLLYMTFSHWPEILKLDFKLVESSQP